MLLILTGAFTLAYILRAGVNFLTTFIRLLQRRLVHALDHTGYYVTRP